MRALFGRKVRLVVGYSAIQDFDAARRARDNSAAAAIETAAGVTDVVYGAVREGLDLSGLDVSFSVKKQLAAKPNVAMIKVWNMTAEHRALLEQDLLTVELHAGYKDPGTSLIYLGEMRAAVTQRVGPDFVTTITSGDKKGNFAGRYIRVPLGAGTTAKEAIILLADAFGLGRGNTGSLPDGANRTLFPKGGCLSGRVSEQMTSICRAVGLTWSVQDGVLQVLDKNSALEREAVVIGPETGMVGTVQVSNKGLVKFTTLMNAEVQVGRKVVFETATTLAGGYRIERAQWEGNTRGKSWFVKCEAKRY